MLFPIAQPIQAQHWQPVRGGITFGISGMALVEQQDDAYRFLIVHDNKKPSEGRIAIIKVTDTDAPQYLPLNWSRNRELPVDLEALTTVPGARETVFMASTSSGKIYCIRLNPDSQDISVLNVFQLPGVPEDNNLEGFALQQINGKLLAVWGHRGANEEPGILYWGWLNSKTYQISPQGSTPLRVPFPIGNVRHISDLKVDSAGVVYITAVTDNGDDGPFQSAVYVAGAFTQQSDRFQFRQNFSLVPLYRLNYHKVEAIELVPGAAGGIFLGTDDENMGSSIWGVGSREWRRKVNVSHLIYSNPKVALC
ncbi:MULTISPECIES: hypothetical protein [unclassified Coleofasciculus]|uniref:hypothetical protein n=1 Tax=unclassified Coleofasciculus TaxID=2692782 RepID=UPI001D137126|nr:MULTISPECIES: hypothetical protein [unclassified Coleofasciculus]